MKFIDYFQIFFYIALLIALTPVIGKYLFKIFNNEKNILSPFFSKFENMIYQISGINPNIEMDWKKYLWALLVFNIAGFLFLFLILILQGVLPFNLMKFGNVNPILAFNIAISFVTNTNWQSYSGENTISYFSQMVGLTVQNFLSAATGISVIIVLIRGLTRKETENLGNFWQDMTKSVLYVLLPLSIIFAIILVSQGVVQNFESYVEIKSLEGLKQILPLGPAASQIAIKQIGTNGGGFFNANSAFPYENPTALSNFLQMFAIFIIPAGLTYYFGKMAGSSKQGWAIFSTMLILFIAGLAVSLYFEFSHNTVFNMTGIMEGKETRFGITNSALFSVITTDASCGAVNSMHSSLSPMAGMVTMINIMLGEIVFGGVGAGLYGILIFVIITVFIAGLMVGRTPEYLGKKIQSFEIKMAMIGVLAPSFVILVFSAIASILPSALSSLSAKGPHGLSEILYAFTSAAGNNGSAFAGLNANTDFYNMLLGFAMIIGRFGVIIPVIAIAGSLVKKKITPLSAGTFQTDNMLFTLLLIGVIIIVGALTFFPALSLGPIVEHLLMINNKSF